MISATPQMIVFAGVAIGSVATTAFVDKEERAVAFACAVSLFASWLIYLSSETPWSIEALFTSPSAKPEEWDANGLTVWAACNVIVALTVFVLTACKSEPNWWGLVLTWLLYAGCVNDCLKWLFSGYSWRAFYGVADCCFLAEHGIFFSLGSKGFKDAVVNVGDFVRRHLFRPLEAAYAKTVRHGG